ncbi:MAG: polya polymerase [Lachnospiraceae bacterium]
MTLENVSNIDGLFEIINKCKGNVELVSKEGDRINLKSRLAQYLSLAGVFSNGYVRELELYIEDADDREQIIEFMLRG